MLRSLHPATLRSWIFIAIGSFIYGVFAIHQPGVPFAFPLDNMLVLVVLWFGAGMLVGSGALGFVGWPKLGALVGFLCVLSYSMYMLLTTPFVQQD